MRRVLACIGIAAAAFLTALPAATADPTTEADSTSARGMAKISEVAPRATAQGIPGLGQFIEIGNQSSTATLNLRGYFIEILRSTGTRVPGGFFQIAQNATLQPLNAAAPEQAFWTIALSPFPGFEADQTYVVDIPRNGGVVLYNPNFVEVDRMAFSAAIAEGGEPAERLPTNPAQLQFQPSSVRNVFLDDSNNNRDDFQLQVRSPDAPN